MREQKKKRSLKSLVAYMLSVAMMLTSIPTAVLTSAEELSSGDEYYVEEMDSAEAVVEETQPEETESAEVSAENGSAETSGSEDILSDGAAEAAGGSAAASEETAAEPVTVSMEEDLLSDGVTGTEAAVSAAVTLDAVTESGLKVTVNAPEGALPEGVRLEAFDVEESEIEALTARIKEDLSEELTEAELAGLLAADIYFFDKNGNKIAAPAAEVDVKIELSDAVKTELTEKGEVTLSLVYVPVDAEEKATAVADDKVVNKSVEDGIAFKASQFPCYAIMASVVSVEEVGSGEEEISEQTTSAKVEGVRGYYYTTFTAELSGATVTANVPYYYSSVATMEATIEDAAEYEKLVAGETYGNEITDLKMIRIRFANKRGRKVSVYGASLSIRLEDSGAEQYVLYQPYFGWYGSYLYEISESEAPQFDIYSYSDTYVAAGLKADGVDRVQGVTNRKSTTFELTAADGTAINVTGSGKAFSGRTYLEVRDADTEDTAAKASAALAEKGIALKEVIKALDLSFHTADGTETEPSESVTVSIETPLSADGSYTMIHIKDDGTTEILDENSVSFSESGAIFTAIDFSTYVITETVTTVDFLTEDGTTVTVKVAFDEDEIIPVGAALEISEVSYEDSAFAERNASLAHVLSEKYGNVTISDVRFLDISIMVDGEEFEPVYPAQVTVSYKYALNTADTREYYYDEEDDPTEIPNVEGHFVTVHYKDDGEVELLDSTILDSEDGISESNALTTGFSKYDMAYIYEYETYEAGTDYDLNAAGLLAANTNLLGATTASSEDETTTEETTEEETTYSEPDHEKTLSDNGDGTYTIGLSVTGDADTTATVPDANVIIVYDVSKSMTGNLVPMTYGGAGLDTSSGGGKGADGTYFYLYQDTNGTLAYDGYEGTVYSRTQTGPGPGSHYTYTEYTGQRYSTSVTRADAAEKVLYDFTTSLFSYQNADDPTNIQAALVTFCEDAETTVGWTSTETDITGIVSSSGTANSLDYDTGTNWEGALAKAYSLIGTDDEEDDPTFVVFITDGAPSKNGGGTGTNVAFLSNIEDDYEYALNEAKLVQDACAATDGSFFGIYAFGKETDWLASLMYYAYTGTRADNEGTTFETEGYYNASDSDALTSAMSDIFSKIVETLGVGSATITDGTTSSVATTSGTIADLLEVNEDSYQYWLSWSVTKNSDGTYSFTMADPATGDNITYTVTVSGTEITIAWTEDSTSKTATYTGSVSAGNVLKVEWTGETDFYGYAPPAAYFDDSSSAVIWNLNTLGTLLDEVTYTVTFEVYPSQYTLDLIADLKNGYITYDSLDANIKEYLIQSGSDYKLLTNTKATLTYTDTRTEDGEQKATYTNPDPVSTGAAEQVAVAKQWYNSLEEENSNKPSSMTLYSTRDGARRYTVTLNDDNSWSSTVWISFGIMTVGTDGTVTLKTTGHNYSFEEPAELEYYWELETNTVRPMIINNVQTLLVQIEDEIPAALSAIETDNGTVAVDGITYYKLTIGGTVWYYKVTDAETVLKAENYRRSYLDVVKELEEGVELSDETTFEFAATVINSKEATGTESDPSTDKYVWFSVWDTEKKAIVTDMDIVTAADMNKFGYEYENASKNTENVFYGGTPKDGYSFNGYFFVESGIKVTVQMKTTYSLRFLNLPIGSTYTVSETLTTEQVKAGYVLEEIEGKRGYYVTTTTTTTDEETGEETETTTSTWTTETAGTVSGNQIGGEIEYAESAYKVTVTNGCEKFYVYHSGAAEDGDLETIAISSLTDGTYDLTQNLTENTLYGGYYLDYAGKGDYKDDGIAGTTGVAYTGANYLWTDPQTANAAEADDNGLKTQALITPAAGETYYIKEVPYAYLQNYCHYRYVTSTGVLTGLYLISAIDDLNYSETGFYLAAKDKKSNKDTDNKVRIASNVKFSYATGTTTILTPASLFGSKVSGRIYSIDEVTMINGNKNRLTYWDATDTDYFDLDSITEDDPITFTMIPFWVTPDNIEVKGYSTRTVTIGGNTTDKLSRTDDCVVYSAEQ